MARTQQRIRQVLEEALANRAYAGAVLCISRGGKRVDEHTLGDAYAYDNGQRIAVAEKMNADSIFDLASVTKAYATTLAAMLLLEDGKLAIDAPVGAYLKGFAAGDKAAMRIHHLLSHTSGLPAWKPLQYHVRERQEVVPYLATLPLQKAPGEERVYSDLGFITLGFVIESIAHEGLDTFLARRLYGPLGLTRIGFNPQQRGVGPWVATSYGNPLEYQMIADPAFGYPCDENVEHFTGWRHYTLRGEVNDGNAFHALNGVAGHAGLFGTAGELDVLAQLILQRGLYNGHRFFSEATWHRFLTPSPAPFGWVSRHGRGSLEPFGGDSLPPYTVLADGFTGTFVYVSPAAQLSVVWLTNRLQMGRGADGLYPNVRPTFARLIALAQEFAP